MSSLLQIREVPEDARRALNARAAARGESLDRYLLRLGCQEAARSTADEVLERVARHTERSDTSAAAVLDAARGERDERLSERTET
ncbi:hypothetical protein [Prauserella halophila]|uniref:hypothetical protein n=1 Tax=Prauserella halophila TaxID=185641 RepID=UPI0020A55464|nr:hypothetical protein [Prauserella halophila]MCP2234800.1 hypothetical protein [Prauserella halophila]